MLATRAANFRDFISSIGIVALGIFGKVAPSIVSRIKAIYEGDKSVTFRIVRNTSSILINGAAGEIFNSYSVALAALTLGTIGFGTLSTAQAFMEPFSTLTMFGLGVVSITFAARRKGCDGELLGTLAALHGTLAVLSIALSVVLAFAWDRVAFFPIMAFVSISILQIAVTSPSNVPVQFTQSMHKFLMVPIVAGATRVGLVHLVVHFHNTPAAHQGAAAIAGLVGTALTFRISRRAFPMQWSVNWQLAKSILRIAWPAAVLECIVIVYTRASYFFLQGAGADIQGQYAAADRLSRPVLTLASALVASSLPSVSTLAATGDTKALWHSYRNALTRSASVLIPLAIAAGVFAPWLLKHLVPAYADSGRPFQILMVGTMFMFLNQISSMFIIGIGRFRLIMGVAAVNLAVYCVLASAWVPRYKAVGAALSTTMMEGINCIMQIIVLAWLLKTQSESRKGSAS